MLKLEGAERAQNVTKEEQNREGTLTGCKTEPKTRAERITAILGGLESPQSPMTSTEGGYLPHAIHGRPWGTPQAVTINLINKNRKGSTSRVQRIMLHLYAVRSAKPTKVIVSIMTHIINTPPPPCHVPLIRTMAGTGGQN